MRNKSFGARRYIFGVGIALGALMVSVPAQSQCTPAGGIGLLSQAPDGAAANDRSVLPTISGDGCLVGFKSYASNLVANDTNTKVDVFVAALNQGGIERVPSQPATGSTGNPNENSFPPALDGDGNTVAFASLSSNLTSEDFNQDADLFVYERGTQTTSILTLREDGELGGGVPDLPPSLSADGRLVAFSAGSDKLVDNDRNEANDVFVFDRDIGATELISVATTGSDAGKSAMLASNGGSISADGCHVAFYSDASNVVAADRNAARDVFVRDRCAGTTERVSVSSSGEEANGASQAAGFPPGICADGHAIVFSSEASNLDDGDDNGVGDVFLRDRFTGITQRLSRATDGGSANGPSQYPAISANGEYVAFQSDASNLVPDDTNGRTDVFVVRLSDGVIRRIEGAEQPNGNSVSPQLSYDGTVVVFQSDASNFVPGDVNGFSDIFASVNSLSFTPTPTESPTVTPTPSYTATATAPPPTVTPTNTVDPTPSVGPATFTPTSPSPTTGSNGSPTSTPTQLGGGHTATPTVTGGGNGGSGGGGGGCSCRIDSKTGAANEMTPLSALLLPMGFIVLRRRAQRVGRKS